MTTINICLTGNPNCGKSSLFNNLTGENQHVGNYPGITVAIKQAAVTKNGYTFNFIDLPGIYSLSASSQDEVVARNFLIEKKPDIIVDVIDSSNFERNMYLYAQISELSIPVIAALNMTDLLHNNGQAADRKKLLSKYGINSVPLVANKNKGTDNLFKKIIEVYKNKKQIKNLTVDYGKEITEEITKISDILNKDKNISEKYPVKYLAINIIKKDSYVTDIVSKSQYYKEIKEQTEKSIDVLSCLSKENIETMFADKIYANIKIINNNCIKTVLEIHNDISEKIDSVVLNKFAAIPIILFVMYCIFKFTFTCSQPVVDLFETGIEWLKDTAGNIIPEGMFNSLVTDGIIAGVGAVLGFFPLILFMFFAIAFFEDTGYMARAVFVMDKFMRKFGLHGKSFASMIIATNGCAVPAMMAARTIDNKKDRLITLMVTPFMICGAKLPVFALFIGAFFAAKDATNIMMIMYLISICLALTAAFVLKKTIMKNDPGYFIMELPPYRFPSIKNILLKMWERGWMYLRKAGTIILFISVIIWAGLTFPVTEIPETEPKNTEVTVTENIEVSQNTVTEEITVTENEGEEKSEEEQQAENEAAKIQTENSYIGMLGKFIEPVIKPIGFDGKSGIALIAGLSAKEIVVSTLGTMYSLGSIDAEEAEPLSEKLAADPDWSPLKAIAFLIFCLIYPPCFASLAVFYSEAGSKIKTVLFLLLWTTSLAWLAAFIVYQGGRLLGF